MKEKFTVMDLLEMDVERLLWSSGSEAIDTLLKSRSPGIQSDRLLEIYEKDEPQLWKVVTGGTAFTSDVYHWIIVLLHRCGIHPTADGIGFNVNPEDAALVYHFEDRMIARTGNRRTIEELSCLLDIVFDVGGTCERAPNHLGAKTLQGLAPDWEATVLAEWPSRVLDYVLRTYNFDEEELVKDKLREICQKWDAQSELCGETIRKLRLKLAGILSEDTIVGTWFAGDLAYDPHLHNLIALVPDVPEFWQIMGWQHVKALEKDYGFPSSLRVARQNGSPEKTADPHRYQAFLDGAEAIKAYADENLMHPDPVKQNVALRAYNISKIDSVAHQISQSRKKKTMTAKTTPLEQVILKDGANVYCAPAMMFLPANTTEACRVGGLPQLPEHIEWPRLPYKEPSNSPYHLYAQINLAELPRGLDVDGAHFAFPDFPDHGTLFIFSALGGWGLLEAEPALIYVPEPVGHLPFREPPDDSRLLEGEQAEFLFECSISNCRRYLEPMHYRPIPYMSATLVPNYNHTPPQKLDRCPAAALSKAGLGKTLIDFRDSEASRLEASGRSMSSYTLTSSSRDFMQGSAIQPFQFFGYGDDIQQNRSQQDGRELLFQMGNGTGTPLKLPDAVILNWIHLNELKGGDFSDVRWVQDCS